MVGADGEVSRCPLVRPGRAETLIRGGRGDVMGPRRVGQEAVGRQGEGEQEGDGEAQVAHTALYEPLRCGSMRRGDRARQRRWGAAAGGAVAGAAGAGAWPWTTGADCLQSVSQTS